MRHLAMLLAAGLIVAACGGCQEKFSSQRYETIYIGQPAFDVEKVLGLPNARFSKSWVYVHDKPFYKAVITFIDGRVADKSWIGEKEFDDHLQGTQPPDERPFIEIEPEMEVK